MSLFFVWDVMNTSNIAQFVLHHWVGIDCFWGDISKCFLNLHPMPINAKICMSNFISLPMPHLYHTNASGKYRLTCYCLFLHIFTDYTFFVAFVILLSLTNGAPSTLPRHQRHLHNEQPNIHHTKMEWVNPCGGEYMATSYESTSADSSMSLRTKNVSSASHIETQEFYDLCFSIDFNWMNFFYFFCPTQ